MANMYFDPGQFPESTVVLTSLNGTFNTKRVAVPEGQAVVFGRLLDSNDLNSVPRFHSKVVSRQHAILSQPTPGRWQIKDAGSSSGTFLQNQRFGDQPYRLSEQGKESSQFEIHDGDIIQLGEEFVTNGVTHNAIKIHIKLPTQSPQGTNLSTEEFDSNFVDYTADPDVQREVESEFLAIWQTLTAPIVFGKLNRQALPSSAFSSGSFPGSSGTIDPHRQSSGGWNIQQQRKYSTSSSNEHLASSPTGSAGAANGGDGGQKGECIAFIRQLQWDTNDTRDRLVQLVEAGDAKILGFYRSLKQFPSAFKDVVSKHVAGTK